MVPLMFGLKVALTVILMGSIPIWIRLVEASSFVIGIVRLSIALALTLTILRPTFAVEPFEKARTSAGPPTKLLLVLIGLFFGAHWYTYFESIQRSSATLGILALATYGIHVTWLGAVFSHRRPRAGDWFAVVAAAFGAFLCLPSPATDGDAFVGFLLGMLSGLFYAALPLLHQRAAHVPLGTRGASQFLVAWLLFLPFAPFEDWELPQQSWVALLILGVFCTFVAHNLWISITTTVRPSTAGLLYYLAIPVTIALQTAMLEELPSLDQILGAALILLGNATAFLATRRGESQNTGKLERTSPRH